MEKLRFTQKKSSNEQQNLQNVATDVSLGTPTCGKRKNNLENNPITKELPDTPSRASLVRKFAAHGQSGKKNGKKYPQFFEPVNVKIGKCTFKHTNGCNPSNSLLTLNRQRSGKYVSCISESATFYLCQMLHRNPAFSSAAIKDMLWSCLPANKHLSKYYVFYTRICCR